MRTAILGFLAAVVSVVSSAATFVVSSSAPSGPGSLEQAILDANATPGRDSITFTTPTATVTFIHLPLITDAVDIDGRVGGGRVQVTGPFAATGFDFGAGSSTSTIQSVITNGFGNAIYIAPGVTDVRITSSETRGASAIGVLISGTRTVVGVVGAGNDFPNVQIQGSQNVVTGNRLGQLQLLSDGGLVEGNTVTATAVTDGISVFAGTTGPITIRDNTITGARSGIVLAGPAVVQRNVLTNNIKGIVVTGNNALLSANLITGGTIAIDLGDNGPTPNDPVPDPDTGANDLQNFPVLTAARRGPAALAVEGTLASAPSTPYDIELFASPASDPKAQTFLGTVSVTTNASGIASFATLFTTALPPTGNVITATATNRAATATAGNGPNQTSELSAPVTVVDTAAEAIPTLPIGALLALAVALAIAAVVVLRK